jgi:tRNA-binding EMAP/Myf-like protein
VIIGTIGAVTGQVMQVRPHPDAQKVWLSYVRTDDSQEVVQIVFGGIRMLHAGDLVPVAPPGTRVIVAGRDKPKKMRIRTYRGERSHGMLCSLRELGWVDACVDEVAVLCNLRPGQRLDDIEEAARPAHVEDWSDAFAGV